MFPINKTSIKHICVIFKQEVGNLGAELCDLLGSLREQTGLNAFFAFVAQKDMNYLALEYFSVSFLMYVCITIMHVLCVHALSGGCSLPRQ